MLLIARDAALGLDELPRVLRQRQGQYDGWYGVVSYHYESGVGSQRPHPGDSDIGWSGTTLVWRTVSA